MTRYLIINAYSARNLGDAAIMMATAELLRTLGNEPEVRIASRYHVEDRSFYADHGIAVVPPVIPFPPRGKAPALARLAALATGLLKSLMAVVAYRISPSLGSTLAKCLRLRGLQAVLTSDIIVIAGGGYMYSARRRVNLTLFHANLSIRFAGAVGARLIMMPQSVGPLGSNWDRRIVRWGLDGVGLVVVREDISLAEARSVLGAKHEVVVCPDIAFVTTPLARAQSPVCSRHSSRRCRVGLVVMDWTWARPLGDLETYVDKLSEVTRELVARGHQVFLSGHSQIPEQGQDDFEVVRRILASVSGDAQQGNAVGVFATSSLQDLQACFSSLDVVVGTRLHSCILAMTSGTPAVALAYQPKATGTYALLGLDELCLDVETFTPAQLVHTVAAIIENASSYEKLVSLAVDRARDRIEALYSGQLSELKP